MTAYLRFQNVLFACAIATQCVAQIMATRLTKSKKLKARAKESLFNTDKYLSYN